ncbi:MAG: tRNA pseudouridine(55) synthase TruB [Candidatus Promineifilaceae bacterium]|jgi:tRNA pseudouridine55 synthase
MALEGLLLIDKPVGPTSHDIVNQLRRLSGIRRIGHAGTLDPLASGLLLVCIGRATRLLEYLLDQPKRYEASVRLGQSTDTFDAQGEVVAERPVMVTGQDIEEALQQFRGPIVQYAPAYSAVKKDGVPLYKLARQGIEVERPSREVTIYNLQLCSWQEPLVELDVSCSSGTYIRSLADDLGNVLGCGGHISSLRRSEVGSFAVDEAVAIDRLDSDNWFDYLLPPDSAVEHLPKVEFSAEMAAKLLLGQRVPGVGAQPTGTPARAYEAGSRFLGIIIADDQSWQPHKMWV